MIEIIVILLVLILLTLILGSDAIGKIILLVAGYYFFQAIYSSLPAITPGVFLGGGLLLALVIPFLIGKYAR